ncbi:connectin-like [Anopheles ziemanni]|uniref:connectin-like n=1 Tax=Anopheles coustani TaxID=139045 RepID=UPI00265A6E12|nr:connectin-like [Anopheles coustani]XP_058169015.1 connectin-like [Anopheles ziemanni]
MVSATYQNLTLALLVLCIVTSPIESRYREKDTKKGKSMPQPNLPPMIVPSPLMNLCSGDREMKLVCHCSPDDPHVKAQKANCWIFSKELPRKDANWLAFQTQSTLEQLKITVQKIGNLAYIPSDVLHTLKYLKQLTIEYGVIPDLLNYAFGNLTELRNVTLHKNQIRIVHPFAFANHPYLEEINLERNEILELDKEALVHLPALRKLNLDFNNLSILHDDVFVYLTSLDELKLESNQISVLTREIFKGLGNLRILKLTANSLSSIGDTVFAELWSLQELDLDQNQIEKLSARAFDGLNNLRKLNLENNRLKRLERGIFTGVPAVLNLNLNSNQLETITYNNFLPLMDNLVNSTAILHLKENRFICDCRLLWLFDLRNSTKNEDLRYTLQQVECLYDVKGAPGMYGASSLVHTQLKDFGRNPLEPDDDYYDEAGHRKQALSVHKKFSSSRSAGDGGQSLVPPQDKGQLQTVTLMKLPKDIILPCPKELDEPTELPLSRESIGLDMVYRSSVAAPGSGRGSRHSSAH